MDKKIKDSVFAVILILTGAYVVREGVNMVELASKPPFNIKEFTISPGFFPVILGVALILVSGLLLVFALWGESNPAAVLAGYLGTASRKFDSALDDADTLRVMMCVGIMFVYSFFVLGQVPFWVGAFCFLVVLVRFLRASSLWTILLVSALTVYGITVLFQDWFNTALP